MQPQVDLFGSFETGDRVVLRLPEEYPDGPLKACDGSIGVVVGVPFNDPGHFNVQMQFGRHERPIWRIHASLLRLVGVGHVSG